MIVMISVLEPALTVSPTAMPTETTVPVMGLVRVVSSSDCCASVNWACAVSMSAWSLAICSGVSVSVDPDPPVAPAPPALPAVPPLPVSPVMSAVKVAPSDVEEEKAALVWVGEEPGVPPGRPVPLVPPDDEPPEAALSAWPNAVSSFETVAWSLETCCSSADTVCSPASQVAWPVGVLVLVLAHSVWAWVRSAASFCWSVLRVASSCVNVVWSW